MMDGVGYLEHVKIEMKTHFQKVESPDCCETGSGFWNFAFG